MALRNSSLSSGQLLLKNGQRSQQMWHGEGDVLPVAVGQDVLLFGNPLLGSLEATTATGLGLAALAEEVCMGTVR